MMVVMLCVCVNDHEVHCNHAGYAWWWSCCVGVTDYAGYVAIMPGVHEGYHATCGSKVVCCVCVTVITLGVA
jgi:hypothetical protein